MKTRTLIVPALLCMVATSCRSGAAWVPDGAGRQQSVRTDAVKLPGLEYLRLGARQGEVSQSLRSRGYDCSEEASTSNTLACIRAPGKEEPSGGVVMLLFEHSLLAGVQAQLQPPGDEGGRLARLRYEDLSRDWSKAYGKPVEVVRPGVKVTRFNLHNGTALFLAYYDHEPDTVHVEHSQIVSESLAVKQN